ncbi:concanavalin A-like lectin/glucanase domain-containing protein [Podospora didyma]|uniref:Concanavalin A-like lectin/glucanase domain-containing protein n=1 Tax=Podospora didyma TaxID=330526 RepID=A0AAE0K4G9_9PEZI|nr:concanavalin A-like lectin/glucanase domain-containing protein [Podospora didyma]
MSLLSLLSVALLAAPSYGAYTLKKNYSGYMTIHCHSHSHAADYPGSGDPTGGFVNYVSKTTATNKGLAKLVNNTQVWVGADSSTSVSTSSQGRDSVRLESIDSYTNFLMIADMAHMPGNACGIWPAFWTYNFDEDPYGEIDIIEGVMMQPNNVVSLHTCGTCSFTFAGSTGTDPRSQCNLGGDSSCSETDNTNYDGCGNTAPSGSYGDKFNAIGGGVYATQVTASALKIWFFPRSSIPADISAGTPDPTKWPTPFLSAEQSKGGCNVGKYFKKQSIIINITFCGASIDQDTWNSASTCKSKASSCKAFVAGNPSAFKEAYFLFNSIKVYQ